MKRFFIKMFILLCMILVCPFSASADVDWTVQRVLNFEKKPVDMVMSASGAYLYVLTDDSIIHVYNSAGKLEGEIKTGQKVDSIASGPKDNLLILTSTKRKEVQTITVDFIHEINIEGSPFKGNADAPVVIVVFTDYQWGYCAGLSPKLDQVVEKNKNTVKLVIKNYPLSMHSYAKKAAAAAVAADSMGKFWEFNKELYKNRKELDGKKVREIAAGLGLDPDEFEKKMNSGDVRNKINMDMREAKKAGVRGTPTIFINGKVLRDRSLKGFQDMIDAQLKKRK